MTAAVQHFVSGTVDFAPWGQAQHTSVGRLIGPTQSQTMGVGYLRIDKDDSIEWTVLYDETIVVTHGRFRLRLRDRTVEAAPGDVLWIPKGTSLAYEGDEAQVVYILYPVNWRSL